MPCLDEQKGWCYMQANSSHACCCCCMSMYTKAPACDLQSPWQIETHFCLTNIPAHRCVAHPDTLRHMHTHKGATVATETCSVVQYISRHAKPCPKILKRSQYCLHITSLCKYPSQQTSAEGMKLLGGCKQDGTSQSAEAHTTHNWCAMPVGHRKSNLRHHYFCQKTASLLRQHATVVAVQVT